MRETEAAPPQRVAHWMIRFADTLVSDYDLHAFLADLCEAAVELFDAASASVLVAPDPDGEELGIVAASDPPDKELAEHERAMDEGPGTEAYRKSAVVAEADLRAGGRRRWPKFTAEAATLDHQVVLAVPLRLRDRRVGALEVLWNDPTMLTADKHALCQSLADVATIGILHAHTVQELTTLTGQLQGALDSRVVIEQAKGVLVARQGGTLQDAFESLRREARSSNMKLADLARRIVAEAAG
jgi:GAF domain-containing protein